jgi:hypothetical protein
MAETRDEYSELNDICRISKRKIAERHKHCRISQEPHKQNLQEIYPAQLGNVQSTHYTVSLLVRLGAA